MTSDGDPLDRLNASERELLLLLGRGHTAKSIAALKDLTELAVNERFRSARRKTGIGSSREIARLLVAQENRDDFIGLVEPSAAAPNRPRPDAPRRASFLRRWSLPMSAAAVLLASAILAQQTVTPPSSVDLADRPATETSSLFSRRAPEVRLDDLHAEAHGGSIDPTWSPQSEATLRRLHDNIPGFADAVQSFDVTCSATVCEAIGVMRQDVSNEVMFTLVSGIQDIGNQPGLTSLSHGFGPTADEPRSTIFTSFWRRVD